MDLMQGAPPDRLGSVASLWRYPVKSMQGEKLPAAYVTARGVLGDRAFAVVDASDGKVASASSARKWARLLEYRAAFTGAPETPDNLPSVQITRPSGKDITSGHQQVNDVLSTELERDVRFESVHSAQGDEPERTFFDVAVLHLLTTATLRRFRELFPAGHIGAQRFRPNMVIDTGNDQGGFVEHDWIGKTLALGDDVRVRITRPCVRCVMTTLPQGELPKEPEILRTVNDHNQGRAGVYASVVQPGTVRRGDPVRLVHESGAESPAKFAEGVD